MFVCGVGFPLLRTLILKRNGQVLKKHNEALGFTSIVTIASMIVLIGL